MASTRLKMLFRSKTAIKTEPAMQSLEFKNNLSFWTSKYYLSYRQPIANIESLWVKLDRGQYHRWIPKLGDLDLGMISELVRGQNFWPWEKFENFSWGSYTFSLILHLFKTWRTWLFHHFHEYTQAPPFPPPRPYTLIFSYFFLTVRVSRLLMSQMSQ